MVAIIDHRNGEWRSPQGMSVTLEPFIVSLLVAISPFIICQRAKGRAVFMLAELNG
jgi:hypothetical protein